MPLAINPEQSKMFDITLVRIILFLLLRQMQVHGANYNFIPEDENIFTNCVELPDTLGIEGLLDMSQLDFAYDGEKVHVEGDAKTVWNVEPTDRIAIRAGLYRWKRGTWEPTVLNMATDDFCKDMWRTDSEWFITWGQFVDSNSRKCWNHKGHVYHHEKPFDVILHFKNLQGTNWAGRYKIELMMEAFDEKNRRRPDTICFNIMGDLEKTK